jgi:hypothetical protein
MTSVLDVPEKWADGASSVISALSEPPKTEVGYNGIQHLTARYD